MGLNNEITLYTRPLNEDDFKVNSDLADESFDNFEQSKSMYL